MYGFCSLPLCPMRAEGSDRSEQVNQLLFGERFEVLERGEKWSRVKTTEEGYEGWIDNKQYTVLTSEEYEDLGRWEGVVEEPLMRIGDETGGLLVPMGSRLPERLGEHRAGAAESALKLLHAPYLWGGKSLMGIDCSGLVQVVYRVAGVNLPRDASQQALCGEKIESIGEAKEEDLCFFENAEGRVVHVGIYLGDNRIVHASGEVRIDRIDDRGIFNADRGEYSHKLCGIRRLEHGEDCSCGDCGCHHHGEC